MRHQNRININQNRKKLEAKILLSFRSIMICVNMTFKASGLHFFYSNSKVPYNNTKFVTGRQTKKTRGEG